MQGIFKLLMDRRFFVVEQTLKSIKSKEGNKHLSVAAEIMYEDYMNDKELTAFTKI